LELKELQLILSDEPLDAQLDPPEGRSLELSREGLLLLKERGWLWAQAKGHAPRSLQLPKKGGDALLALLPYRFAIQLEFAALLAQHPPLRFGRDTPRQAEPQLAGLLEEGALHRLRQEVEAGCFAALEPEEARYREIYQLIQRVHLGF